MHHVATDTSTELTFEEAQALSLDSRARSPDGYEVTYGTSEAGFFPLFFFEGADHGTLYLKGHHTAKRVTRVSEAPWPYERVRFIGWIIRR